MGTKVEVGVLLAALVAGVLLSPEPAVAGSSVAGLQSAGEAEGAADEGGAPDSSEPDGDPPPGAPDAPPPGAPDAPPPGAPDAPPNDEPDAKAPWSHRFPRSRHQVTVQLGFQHGYGNTFAAPVGVSTPALLVGVRPGLPFLEVRLHYTVSVNKLMHPDGVERRVGFAAVDLAGVFELRQGRLRVAMLLGPDVGFVHNGLGAGFQFGAILGSRSLIDVAPAVSIGPFFDARAVVYDLPGSDLPLYRVEDGLLIAGHSDMQLQLGFAISLL